MNNVTAAIARRLGIIFVLVLCCSAVPDSMALMQGQPPAPRDEYKPISELPPAEQMPAAPLLIAAYSFVIVGVFLYVVSVARRLTTVQREIERLEADVKRTGRA
jgi:CcmD family protein